MVWLEISVWLPALGPVILNVCTQDFRSLHLGTGSHVFTEKRAEDSCVFQSVNYSLKRLTFPISMAGRGAWDCVNEEGVELVMDVLSPWCSVSTRMLPVCLQHLESHHHPGEPAAVDILWRGKRSAKSVGFALILTPSYWLPLSS